MSSKSEPGFVRIKDKIPYHGKGADDLLGALRKILSDPPNKFVQKIVLEVGVPHIYLEKFVPAAEALEVPQLSLHDAIRTNKMDEYVNEKDLPPMQQLWDIFSLIQEEGLEVAAVVVGDKIKFQKWLGVRIPSKNMSIFGTPLHVLGELPEDVFVVCGAGARTAELDEFKYSVKGTV